MRNWKIKKKYLWLLMITFLFILVSKITNNEAIKIVLRTIIFLDILCYFIWYMDYLSKYKKSFTYIFDLSKNRRYIKVGYDFIFAILISVVALLVGDILVHFFKATDADVKLIIDLISAIAVLNFTFQAMCTLLNIKFRHLIIIFIGFYSIGYFDISWWTAIPLVTAILLYFNSEDVFALISDVEINKDQVPYEMKKKWARFKITVLFGSMWVYSALVISSILEKTIVFFIVIRFIHNNTMSKWTIKEVESKSSIYQKVFTLGCIRIVVAMLLIAIGVILYNWRIKKLDVLHSYMEIIELNKAKKLSKYKAKRYKKSKH